MATRLSGWGALTLLAAVGSAAACYGASFAWNGGAGPGQWNLGANWTILYGDDADGVPDGDDDVFLANTGGQTVDLDVAGLAVNHVTIWTGTTFSGNFGLTIHGSVFYNSNLVLSAKGTIEFKSTGSGSGNVTIFGANTVVAHNDTSLGSGDLWLMAGTLAAGTSARSFSNNLISSQETGGNFTFGATGNYNNITFTEGSPTLSGNNAHSFTVAGASMTVQIDGALEEGGSYNVGITKAGAGTLYLKGANTFGSNSVVAINAGTLKIDAESGLGALTNDVTFGGGTLQVAGSFTANADKTFTVGASTGGLNIDSGQTLTLSTAGQLTAGTGGTLVKSGDGNLAISAANTDFDGTLRVDAGTLILSGSDNAVGDATNRATLTLNGGTVTVEYNTNLNFLANLAVTASSTAISNRATSGAGKAHSFNATTLGACTLDVKGGDKVTSETAQLTFNALTLTGHGTINVTDPTGGGTAKASVTTVGGSGCNLTIGGNGDTGITGAISTGAGTLAKDGSGTLTLSGTSPYGGATTVNAGKLLVDGTVSNSAVTVGTDGRLGGTGTVGGALVVNGTLVPGASIGTLSAGAGAALAGTYTAEVNAITDQCDLLAVTGNLSLDGTLEVDVTGTLNESKIYVIATFTGTGSGTFDTITGLPDGWGVVYDVNDKRVHIHKGPTPVTLDRFVATGQPTGVLLEWECLSELRNAGFDVYGRPKGSGEDTWQALNSSLIPGRLTAATPKLYRWFHVTSGTWEYKLVSESIQGERETFGRLAGPVGPMPALPDGLLGPLAGYTPAGLSGLAATAQTLTGKDLHEKLGKVASKASRASIPSIKVRQVASRCSSTTPLMSGGQASFAGGVQAQMAVCTLVRALTSASVSCGTGASATLASAVTLASVDGRVAGLGEVPVGNTAKVTTKGRGVVWLAQSALPPGYDVQKLRILREGRSVRALALRPGGLALWAPGYEDQYTDKDAFFVRASRVTTPVGRKLRAHGLFGDPRAPVTVHTGVSSQDYHDVYYSWSSSLQPYNYPPWFSNKFLSDGTTQTFTLATSRLAAGAGVLRVRLWSLSDEPGEAPDHTLEVFVNGAPAGQTSWDGGGTMLELGFPIAAGVLLEGNNEFQLRTPALASGARVLSFLHALSLEYPQQLRASSPLEIWCPGPTSGLFEVVGMPSADAWVVDVTYGSHSLLLPCETQPAADGTYTLRFAGDPTGPCRYMVAPLGMELTPQSVRSRTLAPPQAVWAYVATGPAQFRDAVAPLLAARTAEGLQAGFLDQEDLFDLYGFGRYGPRGIQTAVRLLAPRYVLLVGRTHCDYRDYMGLGMDPQCPTILVATSELGSVAGDAMYGDLGKGYPEVAVGRLPLRTPGEVTVAVNRILSYQGGGPSGYAGVLLADKADLEAGEFGLELDGLAEAVPDVTWTKIYVGYPPIDTPAAARTALIEEVNAGASLVVYNGHASAGRLGMTAIISNQNTSDWTGNAVLALSTCNGNNHLNYDPSYYSLVEKLLGQSGGGISASIGSPTYLSSRPHMNFMEQLVQTSRQADARWGDALLAAQQWAHLESQSAGADVNYADLAKSECLLGDPALPVQADAGGASVPPPPAPPPPDPGEEF